MSGGRVSAPASSAWHFGAMQAMSERLSMSPIGRIQPENDNTTCRMSTGVWHCCCTSSLPHSGLDLQRPLADGLEGRLVRALAGHRLPAFHHRHVHARLEPNGHTWLGLAVDRLGCDSRYQQVGPDCQQPKGNPWLSEGRNAGSHTAAVYSTKQAASSARIVQAASDGAAAAHPARL
jgi:hypothetical protein